MYQVTVSRYILLFVLAATTYTNTQDLALHNAVRERDIEKAERLISQSHNVNEQDQDGSTPLHLAALHGHTNMAALLMENNANLNAQDKRRAKPVHIAVQNWHIPTAALLFEYGKKPRIQVCQPSTDTYTILTSRYLSPRIFDVFDREYVSKNYLPKENIKHRNAPDTATPGTTLAGIVDQAVNSIMQTGHPTHETEIIKQCDFSPSDKTGAIILRCKNHPFIIKLFIENADSMAQPFAKSLQADGMFTMSGGLSRYLTGFSRIKNLYTFASKLSKHPYWRSQVDVPRAWFYIPKNTPYLSMYGSNFPGDATYTMHTPTAYAIICDEITGSSDNIDETTIFQLFQDFDNQIDPNPSNFIREEETGKIVLIDAEHFPSIVGLDNTRMHSTSYMSWYLQLAIKCAHSTIRGHTLI